MLITRQTPALFSVSLLWVVSAENGLFQSPRDHHSFFYHIVYLGKVSEDLFFSQFTLFPGGKKKINLDKIFLGAENLLLSLLEWKVTFIDLLCSNSEFSPDNHELVHKHRSSVNSAT